ncbi:hypothetical protein [Olleya aquimaris]|uniref:Peptidase M48 domain-containing protein n=1 Tax=Olleya aquimaris TaxID=639310 RepID=A0A327R8F4_9FLAO|nr:hypothetical protein [Olleya aquimaris]RAJ12951.1 hypothetical protein LY08_02233 [Olleya aquimaris]
MRLILIINLLMTQFTQAQYTIPESIKEEVNIALSYYPELKDTSINFEFKKSIKKSTMQAQPVFSTLLNSKNNRRYNIFISKTVNISGELFYTKDMPKDVIIGWIGHELGHIMDYKNRGGLNLIWFGLKYLLSSHSIIKAERAADTYAIRAGMEDYILKTKDFILNQSNIDKKYLSRINKYYLSPEEIMEVIKERDLEVSKL